jgi:hypothetical protein
VEGGIFWTGLPRKWRKRVADFVAFDCDVVYAVQEGSKTASKGAQNGSYYPGNDRCAVIYIHFQTRRREAIFTFWEASDDDVVMALL